MDGHMFDGCAEMLFWFIWSLVGIIALLLIMVIWSPSWGWKDWTLLSVLWIVIGKGVIHISQ